MDYTKEICNECRFWVSADGRCLKRPGAWCEGSEQACSAFRLCETSRRERRLATRDKKEESKNILPGFEELFIDNAEGEAAEGTMRAPEIRKKATALCTVLKKKLRRNPPRKDGTPGMLYLRLRMVTAAELKPEVVELPLETADETTALIRCGFLLRTLRKLGRRIVGRLADYAEALAPPKPEQKHGANVPGYVLSPRPRLDKEGARGDNED